MREKANRLPKGLGFGYNFASVEPSYLSTWNRAGVELISPALPRAPVCGPAFPAGVLYRMRSYLASGGEDEPVLADGSA
jgi:hypothetical protein